MASTETFDDNDTDIDVRIKQAVAERRGRIDERLESELSGQAKTLYEACLHLITAGGKRLRPALSLVVAEAYTERSYLDIDYTNVSPPGESYTVDVMAGAASVELAHTFTLIHDDIMDNDDLRRGVEAVHNAYDQDMAILAGDTLHSRSMDVLLTSDAPLANKAEASELFSETITGICEGQVNDIEFESRSDVTLDEYIEMIQNKTAVLYGAAAALPVTLMGASDETVESLYEYGRNIGMAFQIQDDILDLTTPSDVLGKQRGSDLVEGKQTVITLHAQANGVDIDGLVDSDCIDDVSEDEIDAAVEELREAGSIEYARETASELITDGKEQLSVLPESDSRSLLVDLADYLLERSH